MNNKIIKKTSTLIGLTILSCQLQAQPLTVTSINDSGFGSLRQAILNANTGGGGDIIFSNVTGMITLLSPLPSLSANIKITGPGTNLLAISGNSQFQIFSFNAGTTNMLSNLTITDGIVTNNGLATQASGAGIYNAGSLKLFSCVIANCQAATYYGFGAGIYNIGDLLMKHCTVSDCFNGITGEPGQYGPGGGIFNGGYLTMQDSKVSRCGAYYGGGINNDGNGFLTNCTIESCYAFSDGDGGGIENSGNLTILSCIISNNSSSYGGGIESFGTFSMTNSTVIQNGASFFGGGLSLEGTIVIASCTICENEGGISGGIFCWGGDSLTVINCTISDNDGYGAGGIDTWNNGGGEITLISSTICSNTAVAGTGGINGEGEIVSGANCIFAGNSGPIGNDFVGTLTSQGYNLIQDTNECAIVGNLTGNLVEVNPLLGPLQDNGGPTWTHALLPGSPAIDQGISCGLTTDQRGVPRPYDVPTIPNAADGSDIGAYEWTPPPVADASATKPVVISPNGTNAPVVLNGTRSSDPDGDLLQYEWYEFGNASPLANSAVAVVVLPVGTNSLLLMVNDGMAEATNAFSVEVITTPQAMERLIVHVNSAPNRSQPLLSKLSVALASIERGDTISAINQLLAFQSQVRAQVAPKDAVLAQTFTQKAQELINVLSGGNTNPGGRLHGRFTKVHPLPNGNIHMQFSGDDGCVFILEASTNLVDWEMIGLAEDQVDGTFTYEDTNAAKFPCRYYRIKQLTP